MIHVYEYKRLRYQIVDSVNIIAREGTRFIDMCVLDFFETVLYQVIISLLWHFRLQMPKDMSAPVNTFRMYSVSFHHALPGIGEKLPLQFGASRCF
jgi:hypothetical protein